MEMSDEARRSEKPMNSRLVRTRVHAGVSPGPLIRSAPSYAEQALGLIRRFILDGVYQPGERLSELALSEKLGISRSPIREALQRLAKEGLVDLVAHRGAFVARLNPARIRALFELREVLEGLAARLAAVRAQVSELSQLQEVLDLAKEALERNSESSYPTDFDFHRQVALLSRNDLLQDELEEIHAQLELARKRSGAHPARARSAYAEHLAVFTAIRDRDPDAAEQAMRLHVRSAWTSVQLTLGLGAAVPKDAACPPHPRQSAHDEF